MTPTTADYIFTYAIALLIGIIVGAALSFLAQRRP